MKRSVLVSKQNNRIINTTKYLFVASTQNGLTSKDSVPLVCCTGAILKWQSKFSGAAVYSTRKMHNAELTEQNKQHTLHNCMRDVTGLSALCRPNEHQDTAQKDDGQTRIGFEKKWLSNAFRSLLPCPVVK